MKKLILILLSLLLVGCTGTDINTNTQDNTVSNNEGQNSSLTVDDEGGDTVGIDQEVAEYENSTDIIEIKDDSFIADMDKIYEDLDGYEGEILKYEGIVTHVGSDEGLDEYAVTRYYDLDHGDHSHSILVGLNCIYEGTWPEENSWVEVVGYIEKANVGGEDYPVLRIDRITSKPRGQEKVTN